MKSQRLRTACTLAIMTKTFCVDTLQSSKERRRHFIMQNCKQRAKLVPGQPPFPNTFRSGRIGVYGFSALCTNLSTLHIPSGT
jgi:hypothetical protein